MEIVNVMKIRYKLRILGKMDVNVKMEHIQKWIIH